MNESEKYGVIYKITNLINNKVYIGQTTLSFKLRYDSTDWWTKTHNEHLKNSVLKYGVENFNVDEEFDVAYSKEELDNKEIYYIRLYNSNNRLYGYNKKDGGANGKHSKESIEKMRRVHTGVKLSKETREKMSRIRKGKNIGKDNPMYGKNPLLHMNEEDYSKLMKTKSKNMMGENNPMYGAYGKLNPFYGKTHTEETKEIISKKAKERYKDRANNPNSKSIIMKDKNDNTLKFDSFRSCSEWLLANNIIRNIRTGDDAIARSIKNRKPYKGFIFYLYKEGENCE